MDRIISFCIYSLHDCEKPSPPVAWRRSSRCILRNWLSNVKTARFTEAIFLLSFVLLQNRNPLVHFYVNFGDMASKTAIRALRRRPEQTSQWSDLAQPRTAAHRIARFSSTPNFREASTEAESSTAAQSPRFSQRPDESLEEAWKRNLNEVRAWRRRKELQRRSSKLDSL